VYMWERIGAADPPPPTRPGQPPPRPPPVVPERVVQVPPGRDWCLLRSLGGGRRAVMAMQYANAGHGRLSEAFCNEMGKLHCRLEAASAKVGRGKGKGDKVAMSGFREPQGHPTAVFGRYNHDGEPERLADHLVDHEWPLLLANFPHAYRECMAFNRAQRHGANKPPVVGTSVFTCKSVTSAAYAPGLHVDPGDLDHGFVMHYDHVPADAAPAQGGGFMVTERLRCHLGDGSMLYLRTASVFHCNLPPQQGAAHRFGTALFIKPACWSAESKHARQTRTVLVRLKQQRAYKGDPAEEQLIAAVLGSSGRRNSSGGKRLGGGTRAGGQQRQGRRPEQ
jgi:hypothetical protein